MTPFLQLTKYSREKPQDTLMADNLKITGVNKMNYWISLPKVYSKKTLPGCNSR